LRCHDQHEGLPHRSADHRQGQPKPRRLTTVEEARDYVREAMRLGRPAPWREVWHRLEALTGEDEAIEAIGDLRELLAEEDLLLPDGGTR
jgi:hypothetical protein